jgi:TrmH family RNA methyltransferase
MLTKNEIKYIRLLQDKKHRDAEMRFVAEGGKWLQELLKWKPDWLEKVYATENWLSGFEMAIDDKKIHITTDFELKKISGLATPSQVIAIINKPAEEPLIFVKNTWNIVLDGIQDPGNLGSIIRIADWFGLQAVWCSPDCADAFNPKVVQATMGSLCRVKVIYQPLEKMLEATTLPIFISDMEGKPVGEIGQKAGVLVIGSEGQGVRAGVRKKATGIITIPRIGHAESLNAAIATGIMVATLTTQ